MVGLLVTALLLVYTALSSQPALTWWREKDHPSHASSYKGTNPMHESSTRMT